MPENISDFLIQNKYDRVARKNMRTLRRYSGNEATVVIPDGVEKIDNYVFADDMKPNSTIEKIIIPKSATDICPLAFYYCNSLKEIQFPEGMYNFGVYFEECPSLTEIWIPESVERIGNLKSADTLKKIHVGKNIHRINFTDFGDETPETFAKRKKKLTEILLQNDAYKIVGDFMMNTIYKAVLYRVDGTKKNVRIPDGAKIISSGVFYELVIPEGETAIEKVTIPQSVKEIRNLAFHCCNSLKEVIYEGKYEALQLGELPFVACADFHRDGREIICSDRKSEKLGNGLQFERIIFIHKCLKEGRCLNKNQLQSLLKEHFVEETFSISTITRDIDFLRNRLNAPIDYDFKRKGYYYTNKNFSIEEKIEEKTEGKMDGIKSE
ncbi:MAG: leucine-rich repeat protein [Treponema sp.]|nr:leucine-rich repeat protein [Treponema sp.]